MTDRDAFGNPIVDRAAQPVAAESPFAATPAPSPASPPTRVGGDVSGQATLALVMGIVGLVFIPVVTSIIAVTSGRSAVRAIDAGGRGSRGSARTGVVLGWIGLAIWALLILLFVIGALAGS